MFKKGRYFGIVMELLDGGTMGSRITARPLPTVAETKSWFAALAGALAHMHGHDPPILHRDIKPENILFDGDAPKIIDLGLLVRCVGIGRCVDS